MNFPVLKTSKLLLRNFEKSDLRNIYQGLSNPLVTKYYAVHFNSLEETKKQLEWYDSLLKNQTGIWWAICDNLNKEFYGGIGLNDISFKKKTAEIGFWLLPEFWGKGILQQVMPHVCNYAFENLKVNQLEAYVETENLNCKKALKKLDFNLMKTKIDYEIKYGQSISLDIFVKKGNFFPYISNLFTNN